LKRQKIVAAHYQHVDGTSFAAPIVTSIVAQMIQANPRLTPGAAKNILMSTADRISNAPSIRQGYGVVNARRAVGLAKNELHTLNSVGCNPPRIQNGSVVFIYHDDDAQRVSLAGDFNGWNEATNPLMKDATGLWLCQLKTPDAGRYQYKFVVDGKRWIEDPNNGLKVSDGYGGLNSLLVIG
jgi:serine protease AprX